MWIAALAALAGGLLVACVVLALTLHLIVKVGREDREDSRRLHEADNAAWRSERRELLNRLQFPDRMPVEVPRPQRPPEDLARQRAAAREWASVGRVTPAANGSADADDDTRELDLP